MRLISKGICVNIVARNPFWTDLQSSGGQLQYNVTKFGEQSLLGRLNQPVDSAPIYVPLASQEISYITGEVYGVTGDAGIASIVLGRRRGQLPPRAPV
jgi:NAD(P)-dependent dehydrogenase (short-subunit alcohol dehydrogenase family)